MREMLVAGALILGSIGLMAPDAAACGGCFTRTLTGQKTPTVVTDHRMVLALSSQQTTLWDQIRYAGQPEDFIWVLPIPHGVPVRMGLGDNAFVDALSALSAPQIEARYTVFCPNVGPSFTSSGRGGWGGGSSFGCGGSAASSLDYAPGSGNGDGGTTPYTGSEDFGVVGARDTAGPYAAEVVEGGPLSFQRWAESNGYEIPRATLSAVRSYEALGSDFLVLRLAPEAGVDQMQPVRITFPGYLPTLPLQMIAAGVADKVGLELMVLSEGPMQAANYDNAVIAPSHLTWNAATNRSDYRAQFDRTLARHSGRVWITQSHVTVTRPAMAPRAPGLEAVGFDAGIVERVGGWSDAGAPFYDIDRILQPGIIPPEAYRPDPFVDRRILFETLGERPMLSRLRTELDRAALDRDLRLEPAPAFPLVSRTLLVTSVRNPPPCATLTGAVSPPPRGPAAPLRRAVSPGLLLLCAATLGLRRLRRHPRARSLWQLAKAAPLGRRDEAMASA